MSIMENKKIINQLDELFNVEPTTKAPIIYESAELTTQEKTQDEVDIEIDNNFNDIYKAAIDTFNNQMSMIEIMEPRYAARNAEVAANFLALALQANTAKAKVKADKSRVQGSTKITNNTIVSTREEILRMISVDTESKEI